MTFAIRVPEAGKARGQQFRRGASFAAFLLTMLTPAAGLEAASTGDDTASGTSAKLPVPPASGEMGFVFSNFVAAVYPGLKDNCPDGYSPRVRDNFLASLPQAEQDRLSLPANEPELTKRWKAYGFGPNNTNICTNYDKFDHPLYKFVQGKVAYGVNLDGGKDAASGNDYVCPHEKFTSPDGEPDIDNQAYRAFGCDRNWRGPDGKAGDIEPGFRGVLASGEYTIVMILRGVHSLINDDDVEVIVASSFDKPIVDTQLNFIHDASYHVVPNPRWRNVLHGRIVNGVLTTDSKDILLTRPIGLGGPKGLRQEWDFARSRLRVSFRPDGTVEGVLGGYQPFMSFMYHQVSGGAGSVTVAGIDCASQYNTMKALADGGRDPKTGQCTRISSAWKVAAVPAFVFDSPETKTAGAN
jgi:hypothetical protein